jgi:hypothetical protein
MIPRFSRLKDPLLSLCYLLCVVFFQLPIVELVASACDLRRPVTEPETGAAAQQDAVGALGRCRISLGDAMHVHYMHYMHLHYMHSFRCNANCHGETSLGNTE